MNGVDAKLAISLLATLTGTSNLGTPTFSTKISENLSFKPGTAATNQADLMFTKSNTIAASSSEDIDLNGVLVDPIGKPVSMAEVVAIYVKARETNVNDVVIGGAATPFIGPLGAGTDTIKLGPGEFIVLSSANGWPVTAGTADLLKIANSGAGTSVKYDIVIIGRSIAV